VQSPGRRRAREAHVEARGLQGYDVDLGQEADEATAA
jgi:hypothetical protein